MDNVGIHAEETFDETEGSLREIDGNVCDTGTTNGRESTVGFVTDTDTTDGIETKGNGWVTATSEEKILVVSSGSGRID